MSFSKTNIEYWRKRIKKREIREGNKKYVSPDYSVRLSLDGKQHWFNLNTPNQMKAANKARDIWEYSNQHDVEETLGQFKKTRKRSNELTVGDLIREYEIAQLLTKWTLIDYRRKFYFLVAGIMGIEGSKKRHDYYNHSDQAWRDKIEAVVISDITPQKIEKWRMDYIRLKSTSPHKRRQVSISANSILRNAKALFSKKHLKKLSLIVEKNPFEGVEIASNSTRRYQSRMEPISLTQKAREDLWVEIPEEAGKERLEAMSKHQQFKIFLLSLGCGFRRAEIDSLQWEQMDFQRNQIHLYENEHARLKSETSQRTVDVDPTIMDYFRDWQETESGTFVVVSDVVFSSDLHAKFYRCQKHFKSLILWLRENGVESQKPLHELRKEYGSLVCMKHGLFEASYALGHSSIKTTTASYVDRKVNTAIRLFES